MINTSAKNEIDHLISTIKRDRESYRRRYERFGKTDHKNGAILMDTFAEYVRNYLARRVKK